MNKRDSSGFSWEDVRENFAQFLNPVPVKLALDWYDRHTLKYLAFKADESGAGNIRIAELIGISAGSIDSVEDCLVDLLEGGLIRITYRRAKDGFEYFDDRIDYSICDPKMLL
jgi:hypothetical protein